MSRSRRSWRVMPAGDCADRRVTSGAEDRPPEKYHDQHGGERRHERDERRADQQPRVAAAAHPFAWSTTRNEYGGSCLGVTSNVTPQLPTMKSGMPFRR